MISSMERNSGSPYGLGSGLAFMSLTATAGRLTSLQFAGVVCLVTAFPEKMTAVAPVVHARDQPCCCAPFERLAEPLMARWIIPTTNCGAVISDAWSTLAD